MNTNTARSVIAPSLPSGEYVLRTSKDGLVAAAERLIGRSALVSRLIDVPSGDDVAAWERLLEKTDDVADGSTEEEWAALAVPLVNAMRLRAEAGSASSFPGCRAFLMRCPPAVAWLALRNSLGAESQNRASGPSKDGFKVVCDIMGRDRSWFHVFVRIHQSEAFSA